MEYGYTMGRVWLVEKKLEMWLFVGNVGIDRIIIVGNGEFLTNEFVEDEIYSYICNLVVNGQKFFI